MDDSISREVALKKLQMQLLDLEVDQDKGEYSELCENRGARDALDGAIYAIRTLKAADVQPVDRWISVKDRLPEDNRPVLCCVSDTTGEGRTYVIGSCENSEFWFLKIGDNKRFSFPYMQIKVTHWMPLPELPRDGEQNDI